MSKYLTAMCEYIILHQNIPPLRMNITRQRIKLWKLISDTINIF